MSSPVVSPQGAGEAKSVDSAASSHSGRLPGGVIVAWAATAIIAAILAFVFVHTQSKAPSSARQSTSEAAATQTIRLKGTTAAVESRAIQAPLIAGQQVGTLTITKLIPSGTRVKKGDLLVEFDRQAQFRDSIDKQAAGRRLESAGH